jgi:hypothetical protein
VAQDVLKYKSASMEHIERLTMSRRLLTSERRLPLRQPPAELPYSAPFPEYEPSQKWLGSPAFGSGQKHQSSNVSPAQIHLLLIALISGEPRVH